MPVLRFLPSTIADADGLYRDAVTLERWHKTSHRVIFGDTDAAGVVYHANYLRYFEIARAEAMRALGTAYVELERLGLHYPVIDTMLTFESPLVYDDAIDLYARPQALGRARVKLEYRICHQSSGRLACFGHTTHVCVDARRRPMRLHQSTIELCQRFGVG